MVTEQIHNGYENVNRTGTEWVQNGYRMDTERILNVYEMVTKEKAFSIKERVLQNTC